MLRGKITWKCTKYVGRYGSSCKSYSRIDLGATTHTTKYLATNFTTLGIALKILPKFVHDLGRSSQRLIIRGVFATGFFIFIFFTHIFNSIRHLRHAKARNAIEVVFRGSGKYTARIRKPKTLGIYSSKPGKALGKINPLHFANPGTGV